MLSFRYCLFCFFIACCTGIRSPAYFLVLWIIGCSDIRSVVHEKYGGLRFVKLESIWRRSVKRENFCKKQDDAIAGTVKMAFCSDYMRTNFITKFGASFEQPLNPVLETFDQLFKRIRASCGQSYQKGHGFEIARGATQPWSGGGNLPQCARIQIPLHSICTEQSVWNTPMLHVPVRTCAV